MADELNNMLDDLIKHVSEDIPHEEEPDVNIFEPPVVQAEETVVDVVVEPVADLVPPIEVPLVEPPIEAAGVKPEEPLVDDPTTFYTQEINRLAAELNAAKIGQVPVSPTPVQQHDIVNTQPIQQQVPVLSLSDEEFEAALTDKSKFAAALQRVHDTAVQQTMLTVPQMVQSIVAQQINMNNMVQDFYKANEDLLPYRDFVGYMANTLSAQHPEWAPPQLFQELPKLVRERMRLAQKAQQQKAGQTQVPKAPAFAAQTGARPPQTANPQMNELEKEIEALLGR